MNATLNTKTALITGGSRGIGAGIAHALAAAGARIALLYRRDAEAAGRVRAALRAAGAECELFEADVADPAAVGSAVQAAARRFDGLDIVVNNAGIYAERALPEIDAAFFHEQFSVNALGTVLVTQAALPFLRDGGRVVNVSSNLAFAPEAASSIYCASKAAVNALTRAFAKELGPRGITVNAVAPGLTPTDMTRRVPDADREAVARMTPLARIPGVADIADIVLFLASDASRWLTGRVLLADGGLVEG